MRSGHAQVGKYQVLERLAVGGMAELFRARIAGDHGFEKVVVIKKILPHLATDPHFVQMFIDEARLTASLDHPGIVQVFELGTDADTPYIAMQYVDGLDALGLLRECARTQLRLPAALAALIAREVLDALDYAHQVVAADGRPLGLVHRDISPRARCRARRPGSISPTPPPSATSPAPSSSPGSARPARPSRARRRAARRRG